MKKILLGVIVFVLALSFTLPLYAAGHGENFGQDRSNGVHASGGRAWGEEAASRAGSNAAQNLAWMEEYGYGPYKSK